MLEMEYRQQLCNTHGGYFSIPVKRGRPPTKCTNDNVCDRARKPKSDPRAVAARTAETLKGRMPDRNTVQKPVRASGGRRPGKVAQATAERVSERTGVPVKAVRGSQTVATPAVVHHNPSVPLAYEARRVLEPQGWKVKGRGWADTEGHYASVTAVRGEETIAFMWRNGKLVSQSYSMWNSDKPSETGMPRRRLDFDPDELSDAALIKRLSGCKVYWWNQIGKSAESATLPHGGDKRVKVTHLMNGNGDEETRLIEFVDQAGTGFRAFHVGALIKVRG